MRPLFAASSQLPSPQVYSISAAGVMGRRSVDARIRRWGRRRFVAKMREWGKPGGRPKGSKKEKKQ